MGSTERISSHITPARLLTVSELDLDLVREISGFLESTPMSDGWAVCLILKRGESEIKADFHPHISAISIPTNLVVMIRATDRGISAHLCYGVGKVAIANFTYESIQTAFPKVH